jgi:3-oxoacid CoA-transferase subunit B
MIPGKRVKGMGGAMDFVSGVRHVLVLMDHRAPGGSAKLLKHCTLPLTGAGVAQKIITNLRVLDIAPAGFVVNELADGVTREQVEQATDAHVTFRLAEAEVAP